MNIEQTEIDGAFVIIPRKFSDNRGWFCETYNKSKLSELGINMEFIQDNQSLSIPKNTFRGIHFQKEPYAQSKLVRCIAGKILDFGVDLRKNSPTYKKWFAVEISSDNMKQVFIPKGFGHGFLTLEENSQVAYKVDAPWSRECERSVNYKDPEINLCLDDCGFILSEKDLNAPFLKDCDCEF